MKVLPQLLNRAHPSWLCLITGLFLLQGVLFTAAQTLVVTLKNGDRLTGKVVSQDSTHLLLDTSIGRIPVPLDQIQKQEPLPQPEPPPTVTAPPSPTPSPPKTEISPASLAQAWRDLSVQYRAGKISPAEYHRKRAELSETAATAGLTPSELEKIPPPPPASPSAPAPAPTAKPQPAATAKKPKSGGQWGGEARVGSDWGFGTKDRQLLTGLVKLTYAWQRLRNTADYRVTYGETEGEISANSMEGSLKTDWRVTQPFYVYNLGVGGYDEIRRIDLKYEAGPGMGYEIVQMKNLGLSGEVGVNYYAEIRDERKNREHFFYRFAQMLNWKLGTRVEWDEKLEWFPQVEEPVSYRIRFETNLKYLLGYNISLVLTVLDQYDTSPAKNVANNDLQIRSSLGVKF